MSPTSIKCHRVARYLRPLFGKKEKHAGGGRVRDVMYSMRDEGQQQLGNEQHTNKAAIRRNEKWV